MNKALLLILVGTSITLTNGCSYISAFTEARKEIERETNPIPIEVETAGNKQQTAAESEVFTDIEESEEPEEVEAAPEVGLIAATDPNVRARLAERGRNDPFSVISIPSQIELEFEESEDSEDLEDTSAMNYDDDFDDDFDSFDEPRRRNSEPDLPELPPIDPTLAENVQILGLYEPPNGTTKLIVQAPEETNSRYVEVGDYLSNGEVLVKSIDRYHYPYPQIVLEQSGVEVYKEIGEESEENFESDFDDLS